MSRFEYSVVFKNVENGVPFGALTLPAPKDKGIEDLEFDIRRYQCYIELVQDNDASYVLILDGYVSYQDYKGRKVTIKSDGVTVWNELKITVTVEE